MSENTEEALLKTIDSYGETVGNLRAKLEENKTAPGLVRLMASFVNTTSKIATEAFVDEMSREHRTIQQSFTRLCVAWLMHLGLDVHEQYDDRNAASVRLGRAFVENIPHDIRNLPTI